MANKQFDLGDGLLITIYKRKNSRNLRLSIAAGQARVSIPSWAPYQAGVDFATKRRDWISQQIQAKTILSNGQTIGKAHRLFFITKPNISKPTSRISGTEINVYISPESSAEAIVNQTAAEKACIRALRLEADKLLPQRLDYLAKKYEFEYRSVRVKQLKGRWGSCDQLQNIVLNIYLMQLPWHLIDYVLLHELTHTKVMQHGPVFWQSMQEVLPDLKTARKTIKSYSPILGSATA